LRYKLRKKCGSNWDCYYFRSVLKTAKILSNVTYSPSHRQADNPITNIQPTLRTAPNWCKNVSLAVLFGMNGNSYTVSIKSDMCAYVYTCSSQYRDAGRKKQINKIGTTLNAACQGNLSTCHFEHAYHGFCSPDVNHICKRRPEVRLPSKISKSIAIKTFNSFQRPGNHNRSTLISSLTTVTPKAISTQTEPALQLQNSRRKTGNRPVLTSACEQIRIK